MRPNGWPQSMQVRMRAKGDREVYLYKKNEMEAKRTKKSIIRCI